jgi:hypothetical protein
MSSTRRLNGCDYLMRGFDYELRRHGYAGNSCQIILELDGAVPADTLRRRLEAIAANCPVTGACARGVCFADWVIPTKANPPQVRVHRDDSELVGRLVNEPVDVDKGELMRFDLIETAAGASRLVFTWAHALMDAHSAEHFIAVAGRDELPLPAREFIPIPKPVPPLKKRFAGAVKNFKVYNEFRKVAPTSPGVRFAPAPKTQQFRVEKFSAAESAQIRAHASKLAGVFGEAQYHAAVAILELQKFQERLGCPSPSFVLPVPVGMRPKGNIEPLFSNEVTSLLIQLLPAQLGNVADAVAAIKNQTAHAMREGIVEGCVAFIDFLRVLPRPAYMKFMRTGLKGEICSLFYGNTAAVSPLVTTFCGAKVLDFAHLAAVPEKPGIGVIFYQFQGQLRVTVAHLAETLTPDEAGQYAAALRARLLNP